MILPVGPLIQITRSKAGYDMSPVSLRDGMSEKTIPPYSLLQKFMNNPSKE